MCSWDLVVFGLGIWTTTEKKWQKNDWSAFFFFASLVHGVVLTWAHFFNYNMQIKIKKNVHPFYLGMEIPSTNIVIFIPPLKKWQKHDWSFYLLL